MKLITFIRESSRVVFIPFEPAQLSSSIDDTELLAKLRKAGDAVPIFIKLGKQWSVTGLQ